VSRISGNNKDEGDQTTLDQTKLLTLSRHKKITFYILGTDKNIEMKKQNNKQKRI